MKKLIKGINEVTNSEYHGDKTWLSSSQLKLILKSKEQFYKEVFKGERTSLTGGFFDEGSYTHSLILEPETIPDEYVIWDGWRKQGKEWESFKAEHEDSGKILLSKPQSKRCEGYLRAFKNRPEAVNLVSKGKAEHSICTELLGVQVKKRSDWINVEEGYIADVKTSAFPVDLESFRMTIDKYQYDLSAALYCMIAEEHYGKPFDFYFICISKGELVCEVFKTSEATMEAGKYKVIKALQTYKECISSGDWTDKKIASKSEVETDYEILEI